MKLKNLISETIWGLVSVPAVGKLHGKSHVNESQPEWWLAMSPEQQDQYIKDHPNSKLAKIRKSSKKVASKLRDRQADRAATKARQRKAPARKYSDASDYVSRNKKAITKDIVKMQDMISKIPTSVIEEADPEVAAHLSRALSQLQAAMKKVEARF